MTKLKRITKFPGYCAGTDGNIYSYWKIGKNPKIDYSRKPRKLSGGMSSAGYLQVNLVKQRKPHMRGIHRLVAMTFIRKIPKKLTVSHLNGDRLDNRLVNLCIETLSKNHARKKQHGTDDCGYKNSRAKITKSQLEKIRNLLKNKNLTHEKIGKLFGVNRVFITRINTNKRYSGV